MDKLQMVSYNVRGSREYEKCKQIFYYLHRKKINIACLQETHSTKECEKQWVTEWGSKIWFDHGDNRSKGTAILFSKCTKVEIHHVIRSNMGRYIILYLTLNSFKMLLCNVYAPNRDDPQFFKTLFCEIDRFSPDFMMLIGDLNLAIDSRLDRTGSCNNDKAAAWLANHLENNQLVDLWRFLRPNENGYTWRKLKPKPVFSRLDYCIVTENMAQLVDKIDLSPAFLTDHSILKIELTFCPQKRGPGYWKFNNSLLHDKDYVDKINRLIEIETSVEHTSAKSKWESLKLAIRGSTLQYSSQRKKSNKFKIEVLERKLKYLEQELEGTYKGLMFNDTEEQIRLVRHELQTFIQAKG